MWIILAIVLGVLVLSGVLFAFLRSPKALAAVPSTRDADDASGAKEPEGEEPQEPGVETPAPVAGRLVRLRARLARSNNMLGKGLLASAHHEGVAI